MRVFLDTNVLVSAFATRGLCADLFRHILSEHTFITGEVVVRELRRVLRVRLKLPQRTVEAIESFVREYEVVPKPKKTTNLPIRDPDDQWVLASGLAGKSDVLVTGDRDLLDIASRSPVRILDPRGFWNLLRESEPT